MSKENKVAENANTNDEKGQQKLTLKERIKRIPFKKVLKVAGIIGGSVAGTIVLGKVMTPKEPDYQGYGDVPFDDGYVAAASEEEQTGT